MTNKSAFVLNYWKPKDEEPKVVTSYLNYLRDTSLQHYGEDTMKKFVHSANEDQVKTIQELGERMGRANILFNPLEDVNSTFSFLNRNLDFLKEQQRLDHIMSYDLSTLLRIDESEIERHQYIESSIQLLNSGLYKDALKQLVKAKSLKEKDFFVLNRLGCIYLYVEEHLNIKRAFNCFAKAAKCLDLDNYPNIDMLADALGYDSILNTENQTAMERSGFLIEIEAERATLFRKIRIMASDSYEKAAFAAYILGDFENAMKYIQKAVDLYPSPHYKIMYAKYESRKGSNYQGQEYLEEAIHDQPALAFTVFRDLDLIQEPKFLETLSRKNNEIDNAINGLIEKSKFDLDLLDKSYEVKLLEYEGHLQNFLSIKQFSTIEMGKQNWMEENLNVDRFRNGDLIPEVKNNRDWLKAAQSKQPAWCYLNNDPSNGLKFGKIYNWHAVIDPRGLAPIGWKVANREDWADLYKFVNHKYMFEIELDRIKSKYTNVGWSKEGAIIKYAEELGFSFLTGGKRCQGRGQFFVGATSYWHSTTSHQCNNSGNYVKCIKDSDLKE
jgi:uncharacterized protein (TIGR02145 family)